MPILSWCTRWYSTAMLTLALHQYSKTKKTKVIKALFSSPVAQLFDDVRAAHSGLKVPLLLHYRSTCWNDANSAFYDRGFSTSLFICIERAMNHRRYLLSAEWTFRDSMRSRWKFAGRGLVCLEYSTLVFPVVGGVNRSQIRDAYLKQFTHYQLLKRQLRRNMGLQRLHYHKDINEDAL